MAESLAHRFGQIIGDFIEQALYPRLQNTANKFQLYLDKKEQRSARHGLKCAWEDNNGNTHDLDFVLEKDGSESIMGTPVAFIESAWRRYTKHSRNKAQEIQGALIPLREKYYYNAPILGVLIAGEWTKGAKKQLESLGFAVLHFEYKKIVAAFNFVGIDVSSTVATTEDEFKEKIQAIESLDNRDKLYEKLIELHSKEVDSFIVEIERRLSRKVDYILINTMYGKIVNISTVENAIDFINQDLDTNIKLDFDSYHIHIFYKNGDNVKGVFSNKESALDFLSNFSDK